MPCLKRRSRHSYSPAHFAIAASVSSSRQCLRSESFGLSGLLVAGLAAGWPDWDGFFAVLIILASFNGGCRAWPTVATTGGATDAATTGVTAGDGATTGAAADGFAAGAATPGFAAGAATRGVATGCTTTEPFFKPNRSRSIGSKYTNAAPPIITKLPTSTKLLMFMFFLSQANRTVQSPHSPIDINPIYINPIDIKGYTRTR